MKKFTLFILFMVGMLLSFSQMGMSETDKKIIDFVHLLISNEIASLSDYEKFYGQSSEQELLFELKKCNDKGWDNKSSNCILFINKRWKFPKKRKISIYCLVKKRVFNYWRKV